jgi:hypothetical protein
MHNIKSPNNGDESIEQLIVAKGKTAPRITPEVLAANIASEHYFTAAQGHLQCALEEERDADQEAPDPLKCLTFCVLVLQNGFTVTGESACASPENFDQEIGRRIARENAVQKVWPLMGYELRSLLASE